MDIKVDNQDVIELAAQKVADAILSDHDYEDLHSIFENRITDFINKTISEEVQKSMLASVDAKLAKELEAILATKIVPLDIWGGSVGQPTTLREQLHKRALQYWEERVEKDNNNRGCYKLSSYGGVPRHKLVFQDVAKAAFEEALKGNINEMVRAFRDALKKDSAESINKYLESIINNRVIKP